MSFKGRISEKIHPSKAVRQGDSLIPLVFLMVVDEILYAIPEHLGFYGNDNLKVNVIAYADDVGLFSNSPVNLQKMLNVICDNLPFMGLELNSEKCFSISWMSNKTQNFGLQWKTDF